MKARSGNESTTRLWAVLAIVALAGTATACGAVAERATEEIMEQAIENQGSGNVDVELDEEDGGIQVTDDTGEVAIGSGAELPADFALPVPSGGEVLFSMDNTDGTAVTVQYEADRFDELVATYDDFFAGQSDVQRSEISEPRNVSWITSNGLVSVSDAGDGNVLLNATIGP